MMVFILIVVGAVAHSFYLDSSHVLSIVTHLVLTIYKPLAFLDLQHIINFLNLLCENRITEFTSTCMSFLGIYDCTAQSKVGFIHYAFASFETVRRLQPASNFRHNFNPVLSHLFSSL